jgi:hypothetical protein
MDDASLVEVLLEQQRLMLEQQRLMLEQQHTLAHEREGVLRQEAKAEKAEMREEANAEKAELRQEMEKMRGDLTPSPAVSEQQLAALQARIEALHVAKLLSDDEVYAIEDLCADYVALGLRTLEAACATSGATSKLVALVNLSEGIAADGPFARQARRKCT